MSDFDNGATRVPAPTVVWSMPWACKLCRKYGQIDDISVMYHNRTTDDQIREAFDKAHFGASALCPAGPDKIQMGRLFRRTAGGKVIHLMREGETGAGPPSPWPPWRGQQ